MLDDNNPETHPLARYAESLNMYLKQVEGFTEETAQLFMSMRQLIDRHERKIRDLERKVKFLEDENKR